MTERLSFDFVCWLVFVRLQCWNRPVRLVVLTLCLALWMMTCRLLLMFVLSMTAMVLALANPTVPPIRPSSIRPSCNWLLSMMFVNFGLTEALSVRLCVEVIGCLSVVILLIRVIRLIGLVISLN